MSQILVPYVISSVISSVADPVKVLSCVGKHPAVHPDTHGGHAQGLQATQVSSQYCRVGVAWLIMVWCGVAHWGVALLVGVLCGSLGCGVGQWGVAWLIGCGEAWLI
jgi:hypothetical protein